MRTKPCPKIERRTTAFAKARLDPFRPPRHKQARILPRGKFLVLTLSTPHPGLAFTIGTSSRSTIGTNCWRIRGRHNAASYLANMRVLPEGCQRGQSVIEIDAGRITLDGVDVTSMTRHELRSRMGMVLQDTRLFGGTIRDNIAYGRPEASEAEILEAAQATYVDRFVRSLPGGGTTRCSTTRVRTFRRGFCAFQPLFILGSRRRGPQYRSRNCWN
jgi:hypothetical protein